MVRKTWRDAVECGVGGFCLVVCIGVGENMVRKTWRDAVECGVGGFVLK